MVVGLFVRLLGTDGEQGGVVRDMLASVVS
jgi:hypothetical protein